MHRIDGEGATPDRRFTEGNPINGTVPTVVTAGWLNDLQENIMRVLQEGGIVAVKGRDLDLWDAIKAGTTRLIDDAFQSFEYVQQGGNVTGTIKGGKFTLNAPVPPPPTGGGGDGPAIPDGVVAIGSGTSIRPAQTGSSAATWNGKLLGVNDGAVGANGGDGLFVVYAGTGTGNFITAIESSGPGPAIAGKNFIRCANSVPAPGDGGSLAFQVDMQGNGSARSWNLLPADYAEWFETVDGQPIPPGVSVVLDGGKVRVATPKDARRNILGITRPAGAPGVIGNSAEHHWSKAFLTDAFGQPILEEIQREETDPESGAVTLVAALTPKRNPDYDPALPYVPRSQRPEWALVGLLGQIPALPDQPMGDRWVTMAETDTLTLYFVR
ncbi:peptidase G2 autoproteolytic cleavage domain-containing protein [Elstera sp.]|jgi:hypothetical protein|uniref:peptidase G2 autoproteolytic cleavage domain-containing protein n=1 Tax=Elstera sp. TaxID=1916664 RepID=UPI0037BEE20B